MTAGAAHIAVHHLWAEGRAITGPASRASQAGADTCHPLSLTSHGGRRHRQPGRALMTGSASSGPNGRASRHRQAWHCKACADTGHLVTAPGQRARRILWASGRAISLTV